MHPLLVILAEAQNLSPQTLIIVGGVCVLIAGFLCIAVVNDRVRASVRWGEDGSGPALSSVGAAAGAIDALLFGVLLFANALQWKAIERVTFPILLLAIFGTVFVAIRDHERSKRI